jgi:hypothetical protein
MGAGYHQPCLYESKAAVIRWVDTRYQQLEGL